MPDSEIEQILEEVNDFLLGFPCPLDPDGASCHRPPRTSCPYLGCEKWLEIFEMKEGG